MDPEEQLRGLVARFLPEVADLATGALLMDQAIARGVQCDEQRQHQLIVTSVSAKQRPRRPSS